MVEGLGPTCSIASRAMSIMATAASLKPTITWPSVGCTAKAEKPSVSRRIVASSPASATLSKIIAFRI